MGKKKEIWVRGGEKIELYRSTEPVGSPHSALGRTGCVKFRRTVYDDRFDRVVWVQTSLNGVESTLLDEARKALTNLGYKREEPKPHAQAQDPV